MSKPFIVYYDSDTALIKAVSPVLLREFDNLSNTKVSNSVGLKFVTGEYRLESWYVVDLDGSPILTQNQMDINSSNSGAYIQVPRYTSLSTRAQSGVLVTLYRSIGIVEFSIPSNLIGVQPKTIKEKVLKFVLTKKNDPSSMIVELVVPINKLFEDGKIQLPFISELLDFSLYTEKVFSNYAFDIQRSSWRINQNNVNRRINKMVPFKIVSSLPNNFSGCLITHDTTENVIKLTLMNDWFYSSPDSTGILVITKKYDPTIFTSMLNFDLNQLTTNESVIIDLPPDIDANFGIAAFPFTEDMVMLRI